MPITSSLLSAILAAALVAGSLPLSKSPVSATPDEIARLDASVQTRFLNTGAFGMQRIAPGDHRSGAGGDFFFPENLTEQAMIAGLGAQHYEVGFFLLGRLALSTPIAPTFVAPRRTGVQGPAYITQLRTDDLPKPEALLEQARAALLSFDTGDGYNVQHGDWTIAMRPLRASTQKCVQCHVANTGPLALKVGDALGVAMYVYRSKSPHNIGFSPAP